MGPPKDRKQILANLRAQISLGKPIVGAGAGVGLSAKSIEAGNGDLIVVYNSGRFRMAGCGSLCGLMPYGNANDAVVAMANPFRDIPKFLKTLQEMGFAGVQNFPTVGLIDGQFRANLEETGISYDQEVDMVRIAHSMGLLTTPYVFNADESKKMANAGADILVAHMGLTTSGSIGAVTGKDIDQCVVQVQEIRNAAAKINPEILVLCHGGPIATPKEVEYVLSRTTGVHGFYGASSVERIPVETAITDMTSSLKGLTMRLPN
ncbi:phosphoenolpyruvate hydrolase-like domain-containing protein [Hirsutella rhossiliensis]|uniref:Phosphoenolpyruvate hydrolase-like domain-containing protein n=1 Tax=Hirsutella rhossiliensis TaxID=111463 RepID=A0A9P8N0V4_9HYPO|nr:phosphoenolpyruvate hydrolase-like domain-containing protein [Hirsutella rhossiliensis]KAH0962697.1 phosphoenolpyruvate hydrolase-like domain-containing protein [Hirsutella rhossiliensis]